MKRLRLLISVLVLLCVLLAPATVLAAETTYTVQAGDSLMTIAARYGITVSQLASANGLYWNSWVYVGQRLVIPGASSPTPAPNPSPTTSGTHIVQRGETLYSLSRLYGVSVSQIAVANGISITSWLYVGQRITIPGSSPAPSPTPEPTPQPTPATPLQGGIHIVQAGNTLFSIARLYGTTVNAIKQANGLWSNTIYIGQKLTIPSGSGPAPTPQPTPNPGTGGGKWIDINLSTQTVTAYEGNVAVNSVIVSTGTWRTPTVTGTYYIYAKYASTPMSGPGYYLPGVPYTMYFYRGYAIHGTYWHNNFGTPMSHGCVNLRTTDAEWFYYWAPMGTKVVSHY